MTQDASPSDALIWLPSTGKPDLLFVLLHGAGADAHQMRPVAEALRAQYPQAAVVSLNGPEPFDAIPGGGSGQQWYSLRGANDDNHGERVAEALPALIRELRRLAAQFELEWERVAMGGFSQGAVMALEAVQAEVALVGRVLAFSGAYAGSPDHAPFEVSVHLLHGMKDVVLPYQDQVDAARRLVQLGADVTADILPGIGHELHPELIAKAMEQLRTFVPARLWRAAVQAAEEQGLKPPLQ